MKKTLAVLAFTLSFTTISFASSPNLAELDLKIHSTTTFKKLDTGNTYEKLNEVSNVVVQVTSDNGVKQDTKKKVNADKVTYTLNKSILHIQDEAANIDTEIPAIVNKSILGRIKSFKITGDNLETVYYESLQNSGIIALRDLDMKKDERKSLVIGDQTCNIERATNVVTCEQDVELKVIQYKAILMAAIYIFELDI